MAVDVAGIVVIVVLYLLIVVVGVVAAWKIKPKQGSGAMEHEMVADRQLSLPIGIITTAATFVGGGYINGTAEGIATLELGLAWTLAPFGIFIGTTIAAFVFCPKMRSRNYVTMLDPLQERYGDIMTGLLYLGALFADLLWAGSILAALGTSLSVIVGLHTTISIIVSAVVALAYTAFGQLISVAYTDIPQLILMVLGLVLAIPFVFTHDAVEDIRETKDRWLGSIPSPLIVPWIDFAIIQLFGSIPWQTYWQRVLSAKNVTHAQIMSMCGAVSALLLAVPPILIGAAGASANWTATELGQSPFETGDQDKILPLCLHYLTPEAVGIIGLAAVTAAVMSSLDSIVLGTSSMFTHNVYNLALRPRASLLELKVVQRIAMVIAAAIAAVLAIKITSIFFLFFLAADMVFIIIFPQLVCAVFIPFANCFGSFVGYVLALILRLGGGDPFLGIKPFIYFPFYSEEYGQIFPFKTFAMLINLFSIIVVSLASILIRRCWFKLIPERFQPKVAVAGGDTPSFKEMFSSKSDKYDLQHAHKTDAF